MVYGEQSNHQRVTAQSRNLYEKLTTAFDCTINDILLVKPSFIKDLGVTFDDNLILRFCIDEIVTAAMGMLGFVASHSKL